MSGEAVMYEEITETISGLVSELDQIDATLKLLGDDSGTVYDNGRKVTVSELSAMRCALIARRERTAVVLQLWERKLEAANETD